MRAQGLNTLANTGDSRAVAAGMNPLLQSAAQMEMDALNQQRQSEADARFNLATQNQQISDAVADIKRSNVDRNLGFAESQKDMYSTAAQTAAQNQAQAVANKRGGINNVISGAVNAVAGSGILDNLFAEDGGRFYEDGGLAKLAPPFDKVTYADVLRGRGVPAEAENGMKYPGGGSMNPEMPAGVLNQIMSSRGAMPPVQGPLPGEASHETNPMHVVDNNGNKEAELMGGEFIINEDQANEMTAEHRDIREIIESGKTPTQEEWMRFLRLSTASLLSPSSKIT